jgi:two-component system heavy metal sensor histidine kinase CusS
MFWKSVKSLQRKSLSLAAKLMVLYTISTIALMMVMGIFLYPTFAKMVSHLPTDNSITIECYARLAMALLLSALGAIVIGGGVAKKGLQKIKEFEDTMAKITIDSLHERINLNVWPKELIPLGERFNTMLERIETSFIQMSQFSSDIAHELRTPLNNLIGLTEIALSKKEIPEEYHSLLESNMQEYAHLTKLIENLLFLARSDHGKIKLNKTHVSARTEIFKICEYYEAMADEKGIVVVCDGDAEVFVDLLHFKRIISNLLSNALRYTERGNITITVKSLPNKSVEICIQDTGIGIPNEHLSQLFNRFYRVDSSRTANSGGLGLGLAIVKSILNLHHATIEIKSIVNTGTLVTLMFPSD